jgi:hypothetical protein
MSALFDIDSQLEFGDSAALEVWFIDHAQAHQSFVRPILLKYGVIVPGFDLTDQGALDDWVAMMQEREKGSISNRLSNWLLFHQQVHQSEIDLIAGGAVGLTTVDFRDESQFYDWMQYHQELHDTESKAFLGS